MALACDIVVADERASFALSEVRVGLVAGAGGLVRLPRQIPKKVGVEHILTGKAIKAQRALQLGLVNRVVEPGATVDAALELAEALAANGPLALEATKRIVVESAGWHGDEAWERQAEIADPVFASEDAREGATAFSEKRDPLWKGR